MLINKTPYSLLIILLSAWLRAEQLFADEIHVAVSSNFADAIKPIATRFNALHGHKVILSYGSTGKHYAQIRNGAPFDIFLAADVERPKLLEDDKIAISGSRFTYAVGKLVLWSPQPNKVDAQAKVLYAGEFNYLAIANPKHAPYGKAAEQIIRTLGVWGRLQGKMVRGENIGQVFQFVQSGNAELGFVAYSQLKRPDNTITGSYWIPPQSLYEPIEQQAVLLKQNVNAQQFLNFIRGDEARKIIKEYGYDTP